MLVRRGLLEGKVREKSIREEGVFRGKEKLCLPYGWWGKKSLAMQSKEPISDL